MQQATKIDQVCIFSEEKWQAASESHCGTSGGIMAVVCTQCVLGPYRLHYVCVMAMLLDCSGSHVFVHTTIAAAASPVSPH